jgi:hypothetical protein
MESTAAAISSDQVKAHAAAVGFDLCGVAPAADFPELRYLREWLDLGYHGEMHYLSRNADRRADVRAVLPEARSVIMLGTVYNADRPYSTEVCDADAAAIARYAWGDDYHDVIGGRMAELIAVLEQTAGPFRAKAYVDTGPVQERVYAQYAGLGWIGKNTCLINAPLHLLSHDREQGGHSAGIPGRDRTVRLRLRHLPGRLPVERQGGDLARRTVAAALDARRDAPAGPVADAGRRAANGPEGEPDEAGRGQTSA